MRLVLIDVLSPVVKATLNMLEAIPLNLLQRGATTEVAEVIGGLDQVRRLEEMGFRRGTMVEMVSSGSPCIVRILGGQLCFRDGQMLSVLVRPKVAI